MNRIDSIDILKGIAIFLMVMGHFLSWQWGGSINSCIPTDISYLTIVKDFIYSFHMPLFFFVSGYLFNMSMKKWSYKDLINAIYNRIFRLLLPGFSCMIICYLVREIIYFEWFLKALFEIYIINCLIYYASQRRNHNIWLVTILQITSYILLIVLNKVYRGSLYDSVFDLKGAILYFPFFYFGTLFMRYNLLTFFKRHNFFIGMSFMLWIFLFWLSFNGLLPSSSKYAISLCGIIVCMTIGELLGFYSQSKIVHFFKLLGRYTLPIYLLSPYFIPRGTILGKWIEYFSRDGCETAIAVQTILGVSIAIYVCVVVLVIAKILEKSMITKFLFLGQR